MICIIFDVITAVNPITMPTERSIPPLIMTKVSDAARSSNTVERWTMFWKLAKLKKPFPVKLKKMSNRMRKNSAQFFATTSKNFSLCCSNWGDRVEIILASLLFFQIHDDHWDYQKQKLEKRIALLPFISDLIIISLKYWDNKVKAGSCQLISVKIKLFSLPNW